MADVKHTNGTVLTSVTDDQAKTLVSYGWEIVGDAKDEPKSEDSSEAEPRRKSSK